MVVAAEILAMVSCPAGTAHAAGERPNIVVILADDLGWSDIGCYGGEIPTPNIDSLATAGLRFTQFYNNAVCGPTRVSLLTGLYCQRVGQRGERWNDPTDYGKCVTVGEVLQSAGYRTLMVGKWQAGSEWKGGDLPVERGFERFFGTICQSRISYFNEVQGNPYYLDGQRSSIPQKDFYLTDALSDHAVRFVEESAGGNSPFFLYVAHFSPHWPLHAREKDIAEHRARYLNQGWDYWSRQRFQRQRKMGLIAASWANATERANMPSWDADRYKQWQAERMAVYAAQVAVMDQGIGRILRAIRQAGVEKNTLVMFLSDNGPAPDGGTTPSNRNFGRFPTGGAKNTWRLDGVELRPGSGPDNMPGPADTFAAYGGTWARVSAAPLRGTKLTAYEGGIRTPLVVRWPAVIRKQGALTSHVGHVIDILPTCLEVASGKYPSEFRGRKPLPLDGKSFASALYGQKCESHETLCWSAPRNQAIRMGRWKLVNAGPRTPWELFDLEADGTETQNLAEKQPDRVRDMQARWRAWEKDVGGAAGAQ